MHLFFDPLPRPQTATVMQIDAVAVAARELRRVRAEALPKLKGGLRALYRTLELPGANPLKDAHAALDTAVLTAYGFSAKKDLLAQLLALNQQVAAKIEKGESVMPRRAQELSGRREAGDRGLYQTVSDRRRSCLNQGLGVGRSARIAFQGSEII